MSTYETLDLVGSRVSVHYFFNKGEPEELTIFRRPKQHRRCNIYLQNI